MKVLRLVDYGYEVGGVENGIVLTNQILKKRGHDVRVITSNAQLNGVQFNDYEFSATPRSFIKGVFYKAFNLDAYRVMKRVVAEFEPDIVLLHTMHQSTASVLFPLKKYPTALFVHGPEIYTKKLLAWHLSRNDYKNRDYDIKNLTTRGRINYLYFRYVCGVFYKFGLRNVDEIVALSNYTRSFLQEEGMIASYIPNGARPWPRAAINYSRPIMFAAGRLEDYKGFDDLILAMVEVVRTVPDAELHIAGRGSFEGTLRSLVKQLGLSKSVRFLGHLDQHHMHQSYINCRLFVMPSVWPETFGKVGIEAMSVGRPVIATNVGGVTDWLEDGSNGFLIKPGRPDQIAAKTVALLTNHKLAKKMSHNARLTAKKFSDRQMAANIEKMSHRLINEHDKSLQPSSSKAKADDTLRVSSAKRRVAVSVVAQMMGQIFMGVIGVIILKIITNTLGVKDYGIYATCYTFVTTFTLLTDIGLNTITSREVAKQPSNASEIISHNMGLRLALCVIAIPVISGIGLLLYPDATRPLRFGILIMSCYLFFDAIWSTAVTYFVAKVRSDIPAIVSAGQQALFLLAVIGISFFGWGLYAYWISYVITICIGAIAALYLVRRHVKVRPRGNIEQWKKYIGLSLVFGIISIINSVYLRADSIMLSALVGTAAAGIYGVAYSLVNLFTYLSGYIMTALTPSMTTAGADELAQIVRRAFHFMIVFASLMVVTGFVVRYNIIQSVSSAAFLSAATPFSILVLATAFSYLYSVFGFASVAISKHHRIVYISAGSLLLNVGINFYLIPKCGIDGAAWATLISEFGALIAIYRIFRRETGIVISYSVAVKPVIAAAAVFGLSFLIRSLWDTSSAPLNTTIAVVSLSSIYFTLLYIVGGLPPEIKNVIYKSINRTVRFGKKMRA